MKKVLSPLLILVLMLTIVACGDDDSNGDSSDPVTIDNATSCEQLMDVFMPVVQDMLDSTSDLTLAELQTTTEEPAFLTDFEAKSDEFGAKSDELNCESDEMEGLFFDRFDDLTADGEVAEMLLGTFSEMSFD